MNAETIAMDNRNNETRIGKVSKALLLAIDAFDLIVRDEKEYEPCDRHSALIWAREALAIIRGEK